MSTYTPIATQTLGSAAASVTFSSIPQGYTDLVFVVKAKGASAQSMRMQFNGNAATSYSTTNFFADIGGSPSASSSRYSNENSIRAGYIQNGLSTTDFLISIIQLQNYSNSTTYKTILTRSAQAVNAAVGLWANTSAITSIVLFPASSVNFSTGSTFSLYGIQVGNAAAKAQGGNIVTSDGTYMYHAFTSSGSFIPNEALTVDYLVVAGGGGGGCNTGAGGGAGGLRSTITATGGGGSPESALSLTAKPYPIIVGAGGAGYPAGGNGDGYPGTNSIFSTITSIGGGYGGANILGICSSGGSGGSGGGGGGGNSGTGPAGTRTASPVQGNNGGVGFGGSQQSGAGGGGANGTGGTASNAVGGAGGAGLQLTAFSTATLTGVSGYYAGGGGGASYNGTVGSGGAGGGGAGGLNSGLTSAPGVSATPNTGSGGGGGSTFSGAGGNGASGIVIIRYAL